MCDESAPLDVRRALEIWYYDSATVSASNGGEVAHPAVGTSVIRLMRVSVFAGGPAVDLVATTSSRVERLTLADVDE
jgi:hypothetical protein